jgi:hypothetical protein
MGPERILLIQQGFNDPQAEPRLTILPMLSHERDSDEGSCKPVYWHILTQPGHAESGVFGGKALQLLHCGQYPHP